MRFRLALVVGRVVRLLERHAGRPGLTHHGLTLAQLRVCVTALAAGVEVRWW